LCTHAHIVIYLILSIVRWDTALNRKRLAYFYFPKDDTDLRLMPGDELRLKHKNASNRGPWECLGNVIRFDQSEEVCLELRDSKVDLLPNFLPAPMT
jgi:hypothetical protein